MSERKSGAPYIGKEQAPDEDVPVSPQRPERAAVETAGQPAVARPPREAGTATPEARVRLSPISIVLIGVVLWVLPLIDLFFARFFDVLLIVFLAVLFASFLSPIVNRLEQLHLPRGVSILLIYVLVLGLLLFVGSLALPLLINETQKLATELPGDLQRIAGPLRRIGINVQIAGGHGFDVKSLLNGYLSNGGRSVTGVAVQVMGIVFTVGTLLVAVLSILVMAFFLTVQRTFTADAVTVLVPPPYRRRTTYVLSRMGERMGGWVIGQIIVTIYYAVAFSLGLTILHVPDALSVGVITGVLEIVPFVGGFIGGLLAMIVGATVYPLLAVWVFVLYLIVTSIEGHIIVPLLYGRVVHVHPFLVVVSLLIGAEAFGIIGALVAVPLAAALQVGVEQLYIKDVVEAAEQAPRIGWRRPVIDLTRLRHVRWRRR